MQILPDHTDVLHRSKDVASMIHYHQMGFIGHRFSNGFRIYFCIGKRDIIQINHPCFFQIMKRPEHRVMFKGGCNHMEFFGL
jgi:hypothetical protein